MPKKPLRRRNSHSNGNGACDFEKGIRALMAAGKKQRLSLGLAPIGFTEVRAILKARYQRPKITPG
jgi:hypothetical protein